MPVTITNGYATLAQVKLLKGITDTTDDDLISYAINAASRQIDGACGQRFWQDTNTTAREFYPTNPTCLYLVDDDSDGAGISTTTGLTVVLDLNDDGTYETALTIDTDFIVKPKNAADRTPVWPYTEIELTGYAGYYFIKSLYRRPTVQVTAKWGWPAVPDDVTQACILQAAMLFKAKDAPFGAIELGNTGVPSYMRRPLHPAAQALLTPYMRPGAG